MERGGSLIRTGPAQAIIAQGLDGEATLLFMLS